MSAAPEGLPAAAADRAGARRRGGRKAPRWLVALVAAWMGAVVFFGAGVAPAAFAVLGSPAAAGALVGRLLPVLFVSGIALGVILVLAAARLRTFGTRVRRALAIAGIVIAGCCAVAQGWVAPEIARVRTAAGTLDALPPDDPLRREFGRLHGLSVALLGMAWVGGATLLAIGLLAPRRA